MSFWARLADILGVFCFSSKFSKLFSKRVNQKLTCMPASAENRDGIDPESHVDAVGDGCRTEQDSRRISHFVTGERDGKFYGVPVRVTRGEAAACVRTSVREEKDKRDRTVHKAIEIFDRPNDIETSLPRYQNKTPTLTIKRCLQDERRKALPDKMEKLKEQLQQKLAASLESCRKEKDFRVRAVEDVKSRTVVKTEREDSKELVSEIEYKPKNEWKTEKEGIENIIGKFESKDQKSEKEKQNCLLKGNLSQMNKNGALTGCSESPKSSLTTKTVMSFEFSNRTCFKPLAEMNHLNKSQKKLEKTVVEYGGGWDCHRCGDRVYHAERMLACGNAYHKTCFSCVSCRKLLGPRTYLEAEMEIHCSQCHAKKFGITGYGYGSGPGVLQTSP